MRLCLADRRQTGNTREDVMLRSDLIGQNRAYVKIDRKETHVSHQSDVLLV